jgi:hypothetical protein
LPPAARGTLFEKTVPLDPQQKLLIVKFGKFGARHLESFFPDIETPGWLHFTFICFIPSPNLFFNKSRKYQICDFLLP